MFVPIKPEIPGNPIFEDSYWESSDCKLLVAFLKTKPIHGWYYYPWELPRCSQWELDDIGTIDSQSLTKLILGKFDWGIELKELYTIIDSINTPQTSQSNSHNDWDNQTVMIPNISLEFLSRLFAIVKDKRIEDNVISFHDLPSFSNIRRRRTHIGVLSQITAQGVYRILQGSNDVPSILLVPRRDTPLDQQMYPIDTSMINNTHLVQVDIPPQAAQDIIVGIHGSQERLFKLKFGAISFDSTNIADILAQTVVPFQFYSELVKKNKIKNGDEIIIWVSSENYSEVLACMYAKKMWLPIKYVYITANKNDPIWQFLKTGKYNSKGLSSSFSEFIASQEPIRSVNLERILLLITRNDYVFVRSLFNDKSKKNITLSHRRLSEIRATLIIWENMNQEGLVESNPDIVDTMLRLSNWDQWNTNNQVPFFILNSHYNPQQDNNLSYIDITGRGDGEGNENEKPLEELALRELDPEKRIECVQNRIAEILEKRSK